MIIPQGERQEFMKFIFTWWKKNKRDLPWRHTRDPYKILVSEVMLQQTNVPRVLVKYPVFIKKYTTVQDLAKSSTAEVLRIWKGMGYNRRALYLHQTAKIIHHTYHNQFPISEQLLSKLPGLGRYTTCAVLVFAYKKDIAMVDTNIRRIITHFFFHDTPQPEKNIQDVADQLVPEGKSWEWHQALMDYGAMHSHAWRRSERSRRMERSNIPFKQSNRYFRGRVIDLLRGKSYKKNELMKILSSKYGKDVNFHLNILKGLGKDGLISFSKAGIISLPE